VSLSPPDIDRLSPDKLVIGFSRSKIMLCIGLAIAVHLVLIGATSVGYIRDRWIDPEGAARRKEAQLEAKKAEAARLAVLTAKVKAPAPAPPAPKASEEKKAEEKKDTPVVKGITELPKKGEIPKKPDDLGISIDETNR